jgi:hypothetical protein
MDFEYYSAMENWNTKTNFMWKKLEHIDFILPKRLISEKEFYDSEGTKDGRLKPTSVMEL